MDIPERIKQEFNERGLKCDFIKITDSATVDDNRHNYEVVYFIETSDGRYAVFDTGDSLTIFEYKFEIEEVI